MELARHSTADLTLRVYMDGSNDRQRTAVNNIARPGDPSSKHEKEALPKPNRRRK
jgi:hypothetical protein